ncbi:hypothetical protein THAOC_37295, partial [Thalassiosira oceanica]
SPGPNPPAGEGPQGPEKGACWGLKAKTRVDPSVARDVNGIQIRLVGLPGTRSVKKDDDIKLQDLG